jgi:hypothetical protein
MSFNFIYMQCNCAWSAWMWEIMFYTHQTYTFGLCLFL